MLDKFYKLRNIKTNKTMFYDELTDYHLMHGWRVEREAKTSEVDYLEFLAAQHDYMEANFE